MPRDSLFKLRRGTAAAWTSGNPTLAAGEPGVETDTLLWKVGDGSTAWNSLAYFNVTGGGAPSTADYLVGTTQGGLSAEIVVGTTPGGELGGTWASPTVDASHSGSTHAAVQAAAEATAAAALAAHLADTADAHSASAITNVPAGSIAATDVQAAINELDGEKQPLDADLTAIALTVTAFGKGFIALTDAPSAVAALGADIKQVEVDFGSTPLEEQTFTITNALCTATSKIIPSVSGSTPTGKDADEVMMDSYALFAVPAVGSFDLTVRGLEGYLADKFKINYSLT